MKVTVEMTVDEFEEFIDWKKDKKMYENEMDKQYSKMEHLAKKICWAVEADPQSPGECVIVSQDHVCELLDMAIEILS